MTKGAVQQIVSKAELPKLLLVPKQKTLEVIMEELEAVCVQAGFHFVQLTSPRIHRKDRKISMQWSQKWMGAAFKMVCLGNWSDSLYSWGESPAEAARELLTKLQARAHPLPASEEG
jgi:hypothetical protein